MPLPDQTPKLPKLPFLVGDAALLGLVWIIANQAPHPLSDRSILEMAACGIAAGVIGVIPFLADYARRQDEALDERQRGLEALARTIATSAEQIGIAAHGMHEIAELGRQNLERIEAVPRQLEEKIAELRAALANPPPPPAVAPAAAEPVAPAKTQPEAAAPPPPEIPPESDTSDSSQPELAIEAPPPPVRKPRAPRRPKPEVRPPPADAPEPAAEPAPLDGEAEQSPPAPEFSQVSPDEASPAASVSADGATRLAVTAYIGIGNRLFIRGEGPGLVWDQGVPLQFVSIGKWRWETTEATAPVTFKLYKNDQIECSALGTQVLEPGRQLELTAAF